jgi:hypothetical protein
MQPKTACNLIFKGRAFLAPRRARTEGRRADCRSRERSLLTVPPYVDGLGAALEFAVGQRPADTEHGYVDAMFADQKGVE